MSNLIIYQYPTCSTCRSAVKWLEAQGHVVEKRHIVESTPSVSELSDIIGNSGLDLKKFFNTSGDVYRSMGLKDKLSSLSRDEQIALLSSNGMLIKRPLVTDGRQVTLGFKVDTFAEVWNQ